MRNTYLKETVCRSLRTTFLTAFVIFSTQIIAQNVVLSSGGQTGTSGTNWSTSGTNPVTITATGAASINTSVITGYLNAGTSVIVVNNNVGTTVNSNISKTSGASASLTLKDIGYIKVADNITISSSSNALDIILWADSDNSQAGAVSDFLYCGIGTTFTSNGGKIVMAGGPDNGSNGGVNADGIPDGFAWNGSNDVPSGANLYGGLTLGPLAGTGTVVSLLSNGGEIILRGSSSNNNSYPGVASQGNLKINAGDGKITMYGKSTTGHGVELTYGAAPAIAISSSSVSIPAIDLKGTTTAPGYGGFWMSNNANGNILVQSTASSGGGITMEGTSPNAGLWLGVSGTNITTQFLSQSGTITLKGDGGSNSSLLLYGDVYVGNRKDATAVQGITPAVTGSTANILIQADDQFQFSNTAAKNTNFNSTGSLTIEAYTAAYAGTISWTGNTVFGSGFSSIVLGESAENYTITQNTSLTSTGNITAYASDYNLSNGIGLTSSGAGTITINARGSFNTVGTTRRSIISANGNINVYADSDASGNGQLDIDYLTFNAGSGTTTLRTETMAWTTAASTDKPYFNGTGAVVIEPSDAGFQGLSTSWFFFDQDANGIGGITIGKSGNTNTVFNDQSLTVAGPVSFYGTIITISGTINTSTGGASGDVSFKASGDIFHTAGYALTTNGGDVVYWADADGSGGGRVELFSNISTSGGHLWTGGGSSSETQNGLTVPTGYAQSVTIDKQGVQVKGITINTNGGTIRIKGESNDSGNGDNDFGVSVVNSTIQSAAGDLSLYGSTRNDVNVGAGLIIGTENGAVAATGNVTLSSTSGNIYLEGISAVNTTYVWAHGLALVNYYGDDISISTTTGNITSLGNALSSAAFSGEAMGWVVQNSATNSYTSITTDGGAISISGTSGNSGDDFSLGLRANNIVNNLLIGDANTGDVTLKFGALQTNSVATTGVTVLGGAGALILEPYDADWAANFTLPDEYTVRSTITSLRIGKATNTKTVTTDIALSVAGAASIYGSTITLNQNLASTASGNISLYTNSLSIAVTKTITSSGNLIIEPQTNGTTIGIAGGAGTLSLPATYFSTNFSNGFSEIQIGNSNAGAVTLGAAVTLQDPLQLISSGNLALNEILELGSNNFLFSGNTIVPALNKFVKTNGVGRLRISVSNGSSKLFPVGVTYYNPVTITNNTGSADIFYTTVSTGVYTDGTPTGTLFIAAPRVDLTWNIGNTGATTGAGDVTLDFAWNAANVNGTFMAPKLLHHNGATWDILGGTPTVDLGAGTLSYTNYSGSFSPFAIGESNFTLPVTWLSFSGKAIGKTVVLDWATASEQNNHHFEIERSSDGIHFTSIGKVNASGNPGTNNEYRFTDLNPLNGAAYYRLKQVDLDGKFHYSIIISITTIEVNGFSIYSEPGSGLMTLTIPSSVTGLVDIILFDGLGRQLQQQQGVAGQQLISLRGNQSGGVVYVKVLKQGRVVYTGKVLL